jgi:nicotinamide-nucleotide amidase
VVVALPGVPRELRELSSLVLQRLVGEKKMAGLVKIFKVFGLKESEVNALAKEILTAFSVKWGTVIKDGEVWVRVKADPSQMELIEKQVRKALGDNLFGVDDETLEVVVGRLLREKGLSLATAESCTGGLLANYITNVSGSSDYFRGGVVAYLEEIKASVLGVSWDSIRRFTVYSHEVAQEMAQGVRELMKSDIGLSTTGIAGPTGGTPEKPVGLVYVGLATKEGINSFEFRFNFDRIGNKRAFAKAALDVLRRHLIEA